MKNSRVVLGFAPCASQWIDEQEALARRERCQMAAASLGAALVDVRDVCGCALIRSPQEADRAAEALLQAGVDGVFYPILGRDDGLLAPRMARRVGLPSLLWSERTTAPAEGILSAAQNAYGFFESAKAFKRWNIPYSSIPACFAEEPAFERNFGVFAAACAALGALRGLRVLRIGAREESAVCSAVDEDELALRFGIETIGVSMSVLQDEMSAILYKQGADWAATRAMILRKMDCGFVPEDIPGKLAAMKLAIMRLCQEHACTAAAIACRGAMQRTMYLYPCAVAGLLTDEGLPVVCDSDVHGAVSAVLLQEAAAKQSPVFFARTAALHPQQDNTVLLHSCGCAPVSLAHASVVPVLGESAQRDGCCGCGQWRLCDGLVTLCRFDGENGQYRLFAAQAQICEGPQCDGTYAWIHTENWPLWQKTLLEGGYAPAFACVHAPAARVLGEAARYLNGVTADIFDI